MSEIVPSLQELRNAFTPDTALLDNILRTSIIYLILYFVLRFIYRRESSPIGITNILVLVLLADGVQNGISAEYSSVVNGRRC